MTVKKKNGFYSCVARLYRTACQSVMVALSFLQRFVCRTCGTPWHGHRWTHAQKTQSPWLVDNHGLWTFSPLAASVSIRNLIDYPFFRVLPFLARNVYCELRLQYGIRRGRDANSEPSIYLTRTESIMSSGIASTRLSVVVSASTARDLESAPVGAWRTGT